MDGEGITKMDELISVVRGLDESMKDVKNGLTNMQNIYKEITKWLLIVVCIQALGGKAVEILKKYTEPSSAIATVGQ